MAFQRRDLGRGGLTELMAAVMTEPSSTHFFGALVTEDERMRRGLEYEGERAVTPSERRPAPATAHRRPIIHVLPDG